MALVRGTLTYASTIDSITDLYARVCYNDSDTDQPIVVLMHGYQQTAGGVPQEVIDRFATAGAFVVVPGMRGRDGASGSQDSGGREIHDIVDAVNHVRSTYSAYCSQTRATVSGYSGGGGNALALACKFPDFFTNVASHFGMSNYATWDEYSGQAVIRAWIGGTVAQVPERYAARNAQAAITNYTGGKLYLFHDRTDAAVNVDQSETVSDILSAAGRTNYLASYTDVGDDDRWLHGYPIASESPDLYKTEAYWLTDTVSESQAVWSVPASGTLTCIGYLVTKRFSVWLGDGTAGTATVAYDSGTVTVTPSGTYEVTVTARGLSQTETVTTAGYTFSLPTTHTDFDLYAAPVPPVVQVPTYTDFDLFAKAAALATYTDFDLLAVEEIRPLDYPAEITSSGDSPSSLTSRDSGYARMGGV